MKPQHEALASGWDRLVTMAILDLSLENAELYDGLDVQELAGKRTLMTPPAEAIRRMMQNLKGMAIDREEVVLTGGMAIWAYLAVSHYLHGRTKRIWYEDGRGQRVLVAAHG
jgi:hypothetical protein